MSAIPLWMRVPVARPQFIIKKGYIFEFVSNDILDDRFKLTEPRGCFHIGGMYYRYNDSSSQTLLEPHYRTSCIIKQFRNPDTTGYNYTPVYQTSSGKLVEIESFHEDFVDFINWRGLSIENYKVFVERGFWVIQGEIRPQGIIIKERIMEQKRNVILTELNKKIFVNWGCTTCASFKEQVETYKTQGVEVEEFLGISIRPMFLFK